MKTLWIILLSAAIGTGASWFLAARHTSLRNHHDTGPTIEQIERLAELVTLRVPVADIQTTRLHGHTGGIDAIVLVKADFEVSVDLKAAQFASINTPQHRAVLVLPAPRARRPRLDFQRTQVFQIDKTGLWNLLAGEGTTTELINEALEYAQQSILQASQQADLIQQARG